jgi:uncharacterized alpha-E superfamily protein
MLSRTADNLFWIARNMERAETNARLLEVGARISLLPTAQGFRNDWDSLLRASGNMIGYTEKYGPPDQKNIESYLFFDRDNPNSVASCLTTARENGRIIRTALTTQVWDALNTAFQELRGIEANRAGQDLSYLTDWIMRQTAMLRGAIDATLLRNDGYNFLNIGYYLERGDSTARLMDVKYYVLLPRVEYVGSGLDNDQWLMLLRALSSHRAFHWAYGGEITAAKIAHFLILNPQCPRSLITCVAGMNNHAQRLSKLYGRDMPATHAVAGLLAELESQTTDQIFDEGLHEFLTRYIQQTRALSGVIHDSYLSGDISA